MKPPYIGITGFMQRSEVQEILSVVPPKSLSKVMIGVLASSKTILGLPNKWPNRYPKPEALGEIFVDHRSALNLVHFNTKEPEQLYSQLLRTRELAGPNCHGFQLNIEWPDPAVLERLLNEPNPPAIVLQVGASAFESVQESPILLAQRIAHQYDHLIDYVLFDPSGGYGMPFDPEVAMHCFREFKKFGLSAGIGVAGGLSPATLHLLAPLLEYYPYISIDAEGRLRDESDSLKIALSQRYLTAAFALLGR